MSRKLTSGRKRESAVWRNFHIRCRSELEHLFSGGWTPVWQKNRRKNGTNLLNHLKFTHPDTYKVVCDANKAVTTINEVAKAEKPSEQASSSKTTNIAGCL